MPPPTAESWSWLVVLVEEEEKSRPGGCPHGRSVALLLQSVAVVVAAACVAPDVVVDVAVAVAVAAPTITSLVFDDETNAADDVAARLLLGDKFLSRKAALILEGSSTLWKI